MNNCNFKYSHFWKYLISMIFLLAIILCCTSCGEDEAIDNTRKKTSKASAMAISTVEMIIESTSESKTSVATDLSAEPEKTTQIMTNSPYVTSKRTGKTTPTPTPTSKATSILEPTTIPAATKKPSATLKPTNTSTAISKPTDTNELLYTKEILNNIISLKMTEFEKVLAIFDYLIDNLEPGLAFEGQSAYSALSRKKANASGYANSFLLLCTVAGIQCEYIYGTVDNGEETASHAWNQVCIDGDWYNVDVAWSDVSFARYYFFLLSDKQMQLDHRPYYTSDHLCENSLQDVAFKILYGDQHVNNENELKVLIIKAIEKGENFVERIFYSNFSYEELYDSIKEIENQYNSKQEFCTRQKSFSINGCTYQSERKIGEFSLTIRNCYDEHWLCIDESPGRTYNSTIIQKLKCLNCPYTETTLKKYDEFIKEKCQEKFDFINNLRKNNNIKELDYLDKLQIKLDQFVYDNKIDLDKFWLKYDLESNWKKEINDYSGELFVIEGFGTFSNSFSVDEIAHYVNKEYSKIVISALTDTKDGESLDCMLIYLK